MSLSASDARVEGHTYLSSSRSWLELSAPEPWKGEGRAPELAKRNRKPL